MKVACGKKEPGLCNKLAQLLCQHQQLQEDQTSHVQGLPLPFCSGKKFQCELSKFLHLVGFPRGFMQGAFTLKN